MAIFIDKGMKGPDDPIFREGIGFICIRKAETPPPKPSPRLTEEQPPDGTGFIITGATLPDEKPSDLQD